MGLLYTLPLEAGQRFCWRDGAPMCCSGATGGRVADLTLEIVAMEKT